MQQLLQKYKAAGKTIGFVPTMGALHEGHMALIKRSRADNDITVCSIFVNPTQFNDPGDFQKYPVTIESDILLLEKNSADILFLPPVDEMYPNGLQEQKYYALGRLEEILEGFYRPGHFQGVCGIVHKLLLAVEPHNLYMGQKDYQQCMVVNWLINDCRLPVQMNIVPTERAASGLALSSRNLRLSSSALEKATAIFTAHNFIKNNLLKLSFGQLQAGAEEMLFKAGFSNIDYISIADASSLEPATAYTGTQKFVVLTAAYIDGVRLIDNMTLN